MKIKDIKELKNYLKLNEDGSLSKKDKTLRNNKRWIGIEKNTEKDFFDINYIKVNNGINELCKIENQEPKFINYILNKVIKQ